MPPRDPDWLTSEEARLFANVLNPAPAENRRGKPRIRTVNFYSSELKAASAIPTRLQQISEGQITAADLATRSVKRYTNTLRNLGLIGEDPLSLTLTPLGEVVRDMPLPADVPQRALSVDGAIFRGLTGILRSTFRNQTIPRSAKFFAPFVLNARDFFEPIPSDQRATALSNEYQLLLLQLIYSHGPEIRRFWRLSTRNREMLVAAFTRSYRNRPRQIPRDQSRSFYLYTAPLASNAVQADVRHRVKGFLAAYLDLSFSDLGGLRELITAAQIAVGDATRVDAPQDDAPTNAPEVAHADIVVETPTQEAAAGLEPEPPPGPLPAVRAPEVVNDLPIAQRRNAPATRISGRAAVSRRFSKRAQEYGRWAEASVIENLRERERRGEISALTWRSDIGETPGWDIDYVETATNTLKRIEVKGTKLSSIDMVDLTANEMTKLKQHRGDYALAMVIFCAHATRSPKVYYLWDPAAYFEREGIEPETAIWTVRLSGQ